MAEQTTAYKIGLAWTEPTFNGGSAVLDYGVWYDNASGDGTFVLLQNLIVDTSYLATDLTKGNTYQFKIKARNAYGYSFFTNTVSILAAQEPFTPDAPVTTFDTANDNVIVTWVAPDDGGFEISSYTIYIR